MRTLRDDQAHALDQLRIGTPDDEFRPVDGFPRYFVGNRGTVISTVRAGRALHPTIGSHGYRYVSLMRDAKPIKETVHRLVAKAFVENPLGLLTVNHMDGCKTNNSAENLEWCSYAENNDHARKTGLSAAFGETHYAAKLTTSDVVEIRRLLAEGTLHRIIAERFCVSRKHITKIANNQVRVAA